MRRTVLALFGVSTLLHAQQPTTDYLVLSAVAEDDPFDEAARVLARHRDAPIVRFAVDDLDEVREHLVAATPRYVALVMRPEQIDFAFQRRFLQLATEIDEDPFVDFAFGYVTGRTADVAVALARRGVERRPVQDLPTLAQVCGGMDRSSVIETRHRLRRSMLDAVRIGSAGEKTFPEDGRDVEFLARELPNLAGRDIVMFVGHGWPREVAGGPTFAELDGLRLDGAVVLNVACYTGVTHTYFEDDYGSGSIHRREVPFDESFSLAVLDSGVVGYTAYLCPRPAGPELDTDLAALVADGASLGDARRRDYDKTVLGFLGFGEERLALAGPSDGERFSRARDAVRDMMLEGATGGVLFGDPACVPFAARESESPVAIGVDATDDGLRVRASADLRVIYLHCNDPTARFDDRMAMKVHARVPLGTAFVEDVVVDSLAVGRERLPTRVVWAVEEDQGERYLQLKVNFPRKQWRGGSLSMAARVVTTDDASEARDRGGEVQRLPERTADVRSRELQAPMVERAAERGVSEQALQAALDASAQLLGDEDVASGATERLAEFGGEGFRAVCVLLEFGHAHYRTWQLLEATWVPGEERWLIALASGGELPNHASWQVLEGLGVTDTPEVRTYLLDRLATEENAGLYMSTAEGLAHLGAREAAAAIGDRILEFRPNWNGVQRHLIRALAELGGPDAIEKLETIATDPRAELWPAALAALERLDPEAAARVKEKRRGR